jgi:hypothetical protein
VAEVVIDGLEAVEIKAKHGKALPARHALQRLLQLFLEQGAVGEVGQRIMAGEMDDLLLLMAGEMDDLLLLPVSFGDVLVQRHPTATLEGLARDGDDAGIGQLDHHRRCGGRRAAAHRRRFAHLTARRACSNGPGGRSRRCRAASIRPAADTSLPNAHCTRAGDPAHRTC